MERSGLRFEFFASKGCTTSAQKSLFFGEFYLTSRTILVRVLLSALVQRCFVSRMRDFFVDIINLSGLPKHKKKICNEGIFDIFGVGQKHFEIFIFGILQLKEVLELH